MNPAQVDPYITVYRDLGVGAFFALLYLGTVSMFLRDLISQRKIAADRANAQVERMATALDACSTAVNNSTKVLEAVKSNIDESTRQTAEFIAYLKGRDQGGG